MNGTHAALRARFETVIRAYGDDVYRAALMQTRNRTDAEDIVQETFLKYATAAPKFSSPEHEKAWLLRVAINLSKDLQKSVWNRRTEELNETLSDKTDMEQTVCGTVHDVVLGLPEKYRVVIHLFYYEGYSVREISGMLGQNEPAVKTQLHRGRELLREALKGAGEYAF